jgi:membrane-bound lytic murein transglycosylase D
MRIIIISILLVTTNLYAFLTTDTSDAKLNVLNSLNINPSFIKDKETNNIFNIYLKERKKYFLNVLENGYTYIPLIRKEIQKANIPSSLIFVAMAESYFSTQAKSHKKAIGLWQFMPSTAKKFGLKINKYVDERRDPIKSTISAIKYLSFLKKRTGKWYLAIMAYNCGEARIIEAITRAKLDKYCIYNKCKNNKHVKNIRKYIKKYQKYGVKKFYFLNKAFIETNKLYPKQLKLEDLLRVQKGLKRQYLPKETRIYIRKIIAMNLVLTSNQFVKYQNNYLLNSGTLSNLVKIDVPSGTSLKYISQLLNINYNLLRKNNLHLKYGFTPPNKNSYIYIPYDKIAKFKLTFNKYIITKKIIYFVKKGDSLNKISKKFGINYKIIKKINHLKTSQLKIKQKLIIPIHNNDSNKLAME